MKVSYFEDTDTLYIEFRDSGIAESKYLDENTTLDVDAKGSLCNYVRAREPANRRKPSYC